MASPALLRHSAFGRALNCSNALLLAPPLKHQNVRSSRTIVSKSLLKLPDDFPAPYPYEENNFRWKDMKWDSTLKRFHQNSKLIVVEGNVGSGKTKVGEEIADILGFRFMPEFKMDDIFIDRYGNDMRDFYHLFPKRFRIPDPNLFFKNPYDDLSAVMQERFYYCRYEQYINALTHIFNTGEGVVLERSVYADFVFANAMRAKNYIGIEYLKYYYYVRKMTLPALRLYPHLVIFLDCPVEKCLENIKNRGNEDEIRIVDKEYLGVMAESYKDMLRELKRHSRILAYDWSKPAHVDTIIEDIESLEFDYYDSHQGDVLQSWEEGIGSNRHFQVFRWHLTQKKPTLTFEFLKQREVGELYIHPKDCQHWVGVMQKEVLKSPYGYGYNQKDPYQGLGNWRWNQILPEDWVEYFYKELYYDTTRTAWRFLDPKSGEYDPGYLHH